MLVCDEHKAKPQAVQASRFQACKALQQLQGFTWRRAMMLALPVTESQASAKTLVAVVTASSMDFAS